MHDSAKLKLGTALGVFALFLWACAGAPETIDPSWTPAQFFQKAQEASDDGYYPYALSCYQTFKERYPDELERGLWADYEIALLHYKMGDAATALQELDALIAVYGEASAANYPKGPKILAEKIKTRIEAAQKQQAASGKPPS